MLVDVKVPVLAESVSEATLMNWHKSVGDEVKRGESLIDIETDKVTLEIAALNDGVIVEILKQDGELVQSDEIIARIDTVKQALKPAETKTAEAPVPEQPYFPDMEPVASAPQTKMSPAVRHLLEEHHLDATAIPTSKESDRLTKEDILRYLEGKSVTPAKADVPTLTNLVEHEQPDDHKTTTLFTASSTTALAPETPVPAETEDMLSVVDETPAVTTSILKESLELPSENKDEVREMREKEQVSQKTSVQKPAVSNMVEPAVVAEKPRERDEAKPREIPLPDAGKANDEAVKPLQGRPEKSVPMTRLRKRIAERLLAAQHGNAILTTFNEINMQPVIDIRTRYREEFEETHGVKLGFMSFFTKAAVEALKKFPVINASVDDENITYHGYFDIGIAVSTPRGLVVPVVRNADVLSLAAIETQIREYGEKARDSRLTIDDLSGGTFTITNGGIFGSLLSTPIINPPQSAILGMHKIQDRPVAEGGAVVIRPIMYVALSYDHRIIDGSEAVQFLVAIKQQIEDPARLMLQI